MTTFYALVDAMPGREADVETVLTARQVTFVRCKEGSYDFLIRFEAPTFGEVDDYLRTHVTTIPGVKGTEAILDWDDHSSSAREAKATLG